jgi:hypothetical protein
VVGLPPGFTIATEELHVYKGAREIVTNLSKNRVELSVDEVHQFFILQRLVQHASGDAPVEVIPALLENDLRDFVPEEQMNRGVHITVDAGGHVTEVKLDPVNGNAPDAYIETALRAIRFYPAIVHGKVFSGQGTFVLSEFIP